MDKQSHHWFYVRCNNTSVLSDGLATPPLNLTAPANKMAAILADDIFKCIFFNENDIIPIQIWRKFVARGPVDNEWALVQVMAWHRTGDKPLPR